MLRTIHLHGALKRCGGPYRLDVTTAGEAVRALALQVPGFAETIKARDPRRARGRPIGWRVIRGDRRTGLSLGETALSMNLGGVAELHIVPAVAGADNKKSLGTAEVIAGVTLLVVATVLTYGADAPLLSALAGGGGASIAGISAGQFAALGLALTLSGAQTLMTNQPNTSNERSFLLHGNTNTAQDGDCVPLCVGRVRYAPKLISAGLVSSRVPVGYVPPPGTGVNGGGPGAHPWAGRGFGFGNT
jgi:predicted phage tail protein